MTYIDPDQRRRSYGGVVFSAVMVALICYLTFAALQGEHGLLRLFQVEGHEARLNAELIDLRAQRREIEGKTYRLSTEGLDLDLLDERARFVLGLARPDEVMIR